MGWCRQGDNDDMFIHTTACAHRIGGRTPGSETPSVPASWASTSSWTEAEKCCKTEAKTIIAATKPVITGNPLHSLHCAYQSLLRNRKVLKLRDELNLRHCHCARDPNLSLRDHSDDITARTALAAPPSSCRTKQQAKKHLVRELQLWSTTVHCTSGPPPGKLHDLHNRDVDHFVQQ